MTMAALTSPRRINETKRATAAPAEPRTAGARVASPPFMTVFFSEEGGLHHTRCRRSLEFRGIRAELEADFYCAGCHEHVTLTRYAMSRIPVERENVVPFPAVRR
jgi:hypothetical protein